MNRIIKAASSALPTIGGFLLVALGIGIIAFVSIWFVRGGVSDINDIYSQWLVPLGAFALVVTIVILLPLSFFRRTKGFSGYGITVVSYILVVALWIQSLITTYMLWGGFWMLVGLFLAGVGVIPMAILATLFSAEWAGLGELLLLTAVIVGLRFWGAYLVMKRGEQLP